MKKETNKIIEEFREKFGENPLLQQSRKKDLYNVNQVVEQFLLKALATQRKEIVKEWKEVEKIWGKTLNVCQERRKTHKAELVREIEEGLPKEYKPIDKTRNIYNEDRIWGYNQYRQEVKAYLKKIKQ